MKSQSNRNRIIWLMILPVLILALGLGMGGCRYRVTNVGNTDKVVPDKDGIKAAKYEKRRNDLDLKKTVKSLLEKNKPISPGKGAKGKAKGKGSGGNGNGNGSGNGSKNKKEANTVTIHLDANGGSCEQRSVKLIPGNAYGNLPVATRDKYIFEGWYTDASGGSLIDGNATVPSREHTLYAHWKKGTKYTVTFDPGEGRMKERDMTRQLGKGEVYGPLPLPVNTGNVFLGWFTAKSGGIKIEESSTFDGSGNQTLYARWEYDPYKYWSAKRQAIYESMYACQVVDCYIEFGDNQTASACGFLDNAKVGNCARNRGGNTTVTDEWVTSRNPYAIIKCSGGNAAGLKAKMAERFPGKTILVVPPAAVSGSASEQLYYTMCLGKIIYPNWFGEVDIAKMGRELGVGGSIY